MEQNNRGSFTGKLGFVLSAAGASVGLGNIWRFPYLAAKYGGGAFLLVYIILALTFGYTMIIAETAIGRSSQKSPVGAFKFFSDSPWAKAGGWINAIVPVLICPYYSVIGGWVCKYLFAFLTTDMNEIATDTFFTDFITNGASAELWFCVFVALNLVIIYMGVENGIERVSKFMMPILLVLAIVISAYSITRPGAMAGVSYMLIPHLENFSWMTVVSAMGQMFYSLSIAMGILITFGSYMKKEVSIEDSTVQVEIFDTGVAILAGMMIIPAVFAFSGGDPKIFASMGIGRIIGVLFFTLVLFAALTSSIALTEAAVSTICDEFKWSRTVCTTAMAVVMLALGTLSCLGYSGNALLPRLWTAFLYNHHRNAFPGLLRFPDQFRDDAHCGLCDLCARHQMHRDFPHRAGSGNGRTSFPPQEGLQCRDQIYRPRFRADHLQ